MDRLLNEQAQLRLLAGRLETLARRSTCPPRAELNQARWDLARTLLQHLPRKDRLVYARLRLHRDAQVAAIGTKFSDEAHQLYDSFLAHSRHWTPDAVAADWEGYRKGVPILTRALNDRIDREERELLPHLATAPEIPPARSAEDRNWAADGWELRGLLGLDRHRPVAPSIRTD